MFIISKYYFWEWNGIWNSRRGVEVEGVEERLEGFGVRETWVCIPT